MNAPPTIAFRNLPVRRLGDPFQVNTATPGAQWQAEAAALAGGGFVVSWHNEPDDVRAQLFDAAGTPVGAEIVVNSQDAGLQTEPEVAALQGGGFVVSWLDTNGDAGAGISGSWAVKAQFFSSAGDKVGPEILVNSAIDGAQSRPTISALANGNVLIVWEDSSQGVGGAGGDASGIALKGQIFGNDGARIGGEMLINTTAANDQLHASVEALPGGGFAIAWTDKSRNEGGEYGSPTASDIRAQIFDASGARVGSEILLNPLAPRIADGADITVLADGNLLLLWHDYVGAEARLRGQILTPAGANVGNVAFEPGPQQAFNFSAVALAGGGFVVAWDDGAGGDHADVGAQLFGADGSRIGAQVTVDDGGPYDYLVGLAAFADGRIAILYAHQDANGYATRVQLYAAGLTGICDGEPAGPFYGSLAIAAPDGHMLLLSGGDEVAAQMLALDGHLRAVDTIPFDLKHHIVIGDPDAGSGILTVTLSAPGGILEVVAGGSGAVVNGSGTGSVKISGTLAQIEALLSSDPDSRVTFTANLAPDTTVKLTVIVDDNGNSNGSPESATASLVIDAIRPNIKDGAPGNDTLAGSPGAIDIFHGLDGNDLIYGEDGGDFLYGDAGDDYLAGGTGNDVMNGGAGNDTLYVDSACDDVDEAVGEGFDRVAASVSYVLAAGAEVEQLEAVTPGAVNAIDLTGNEFSQSVAGNNGTNILRGDGGNDVLVGYGGDDYLVGGPGQDVMDGGDGNDTFYLDSAGDVVIDSAGADRIATAVSYTLGAGAGIEILEAINLTDTTAINLVGNGFGQTVIGNAGANLLAGKGGADVLVGAGGSDAFLFDTPLGPGNVDRIADFLSGTDRILLDDAVFVGLSPGVLPAAAFVVGFQPQDADDRIVYNPATGQLYFDADGNGAAASILFATLDGHPVLTASDFIVI